MSTFAKKTFDVAAYFAARPVYPSSFYAFLYDLHASRGGRFDTAIDLGTVSRL